MITQNCDDVPVLNLMHRPDPKRPPNMQDKRTVVPLETGDWDTWLRGTVEQAGALIKLPRLELFVHRVRTRRSRWRYLSGPCDMHATVTTCAD